MKITIFTPTHKTQFLARLAGSIEKQTYDNFEWLVVPNGGVLPSDIHVSLPQLKVIQYVGETDNIGEIKRFACMNASGDVVLEADHDDELTPDALEVVANEFGDADFVYSNCCEVCNDKPRKYGEGFGWEYRDFEWNSEKFYECISFPPSPASFAKIWFAPNHLRAWKKDFYERLGGHEKSRRVLDDQDLLARTYIEGKVKWIDRCLYVYHLHRGQTYSQKGINEHIQRETLNLHDKYIYGLVERWCDLNGLRKIDLCGGINCPEGYESIDLKDADILYNLDRNEWPFKDGEVGLFRAHDALEHLKDPINTMKEVYRCLAPNGWLLSSTPSTEGRAAFQDPTHRSFWNANSFWYYTRKEQAGYIGTPVKFQASRVKTFFPSQWHENNKMPYVKADLMKFSGRVPGRVYM